MKKLQRPLHKKDKATLDAFAVSVCVRVRCLPRQLLTLLVCAFCSAACLLQVHDYAPVIARSVLCMLSPVLLPLRTLIAVSSHCVPVSCALRSGSHLPFIDVFDFENQNLDNIRYHIGFLGTLLSAAAVAACSMHASRQGHAHHPWCVVRSFLALCAAVVQANASVPSARSRSTSELLSSSRLLTTQG